MSRSLHVESRGAECTAPARKRLALPDLSLHAHELTSSVGQQLQSANNAWDLLSERRNQRGPRDQARSPLWIAAAAYINGKCYGVATASVKRLIIRASVVERRNMSSRQPQTLFQQAQVRKCRGYMSASVTDDICLAQATYSKAAKAELSDLDRAFRLYVKAAEDFLNIGQSTPDATLRSKCKDEAAKALDRAEKIKAAKPDLTPVATNYFSERGLAMPSGRVHMLTGFRCFVTIEAQRSVLRRSSFVNNVRIPLWDEDPVSLDENR